MEQIGKQLKEARLEKGIELEAVEQATKIRRKYLEAIEAGDFEVIPGEVFLKGFLTQYAKYLGLDAEQIKAEYKELKDLKVAEEEESAESTADKESKKELNPFLEDLLNWFKNSKVKIIVTVLVIALIISLGAVLLKSDIFLNLTESFRLANQQQSQEQLLDDEDEDLETEELEAEIELEEEATEEEATEEEDIAIVDEDSIQEEENDLSTDETEEVQEQEEEESEEVEEQELEDEEELVEEDEEELESEIEEEVEENSAVEELEVEEEIEPDENEISQIVNAEDETTEIYELNDEADFVLEIIDRAWIRVMIDGEQVLADILAAGERRSWAVEETVEVLSSNAAGLKVIMEDEVLGPFGEQGEVVQKEFIVETE
ncbi:helix-turn-helix domain-containing protein [Fuchsiella alkaliacetigena]|uniref:helix-turn-helix domain-containing protein n=1 Tax=Fuchsiella alkaliacetigena TaxID=957042 RepID=UPI00200B331B|nr:helix-turn-helix domain-containing protein [Fuchsiella alkaliacetigena]MCK8823473.1 DUF4115 domain-containing protein [Fuchsiella alkaliacetigena]